MKAFVKNSSAKHGCKDCANEDLEKYNIQSTETPIEEVLERFYTKDTPLPIYCLKCGMPIDGTDLEINRESTVLNKPIKDVSEILLSRQPDFEYKNVKLFEAETIFNLLWGEQHKDIHPYVKDVYLKKIVDSLNAYYFSYTKSNLHFTLREDETVNEVACKHAIDYNKSIAIIENLHLEDLKEIAG